MSEQERVLAGRYQVGEIIGRGGMADVFEGVDLRLGRKIAIKLLKSDLANEENFEADQDRESAQMAEQEPKAFATRPLRDFPEESPAHKEGQANEGYCGGQPREFIADLVSSPVQEHVQFGQDRPA